jgi:hypothetical protein
MIHSSAELLERFSEENNLDLGVLRGEPYRHRRGISRAPYTIETGLSQDTLQSCNISDNISGIRISKKMRFANSIMQITNAVTIAKSLGAKRLYFPGFWYLKEGVYHCSSGLEITNSDKNDPCPDEIILAGIFLKMAALHRLCSISLNPRKVMRELRAFLTFDLNAPPYRTNDLVIHIRSGDIFSAPHRHYGQPPISFYKKIVRSRNWETVRVVFENDLNPVIAPLLEWLPSHCNETIAISGQLKDDLEVLLRARNLVSGRSTFVPSICALTRNLRNVYYWHEKPFDSWGNRKVNKLGIIDTSGAYRHAICSGNWTNSAEQRQMMLDYPETSLSLCEPMSTG